MAYYKPQSPLKKGDDYFYPLTTIGQIIKEDNSRLSEDDFGVKMDLLWTNASPTSPFSPQTISLDLSKYKFIIVENSSKNADASYYYYTRTSAHVFPIDGRDRYLTTTLFYFAYRTINVSASGVTLSDSIRQNSYNSTNVNTDNTQNIPHRIWGIK